MIILDQLPLFTNETEAVLSDGSRVAVRGFQIIVWVSLSLKGLAELPQKAPRFPAILDTGHNHNFSIRHDHLRHCLFSPENILPPELPFTVNINGQPVRHFAANVWLHPNRRGQRDVFARKKPVCLELAEGMAIFAPGAGGPRLPLLGLRALVTNQLVLTIDGKRMRVSLKNAR